MPPVMMLPAVILPVPLIDPPDPLVIKLPLAILAVVVMLAVEFKAETTLPLKLNPAAFKLPPDTLPVTLNAVNVPTLVMLVCAAVISVPLMFPPTKLPPVTLPVTETVLPV